MTATEFARAWALLHRKRVDGPWYDFGKHRRAWNQQLLTYLNDLARHRMSL